ncbi:hypothetical protein ACQ5ES_00180 [Pseudidiomarina sp. E22-M8]|uniref:hypothetical protein n=1 Tax=Pseudidiomarina sp. E22-M8 TaxID=3424768 RepID=UPI00403C8842
MKVYLVGGAVRDKLLGKALHERDYVVVGATPEEMLARGFRQVGKDFPVFLHPHTDEEYALARTERKSGPGYTGFTIAAEPSVTLEQDLQRRDLTINAIAEADDGQLIDPYGGLADLKARMLRHVSSAFVEDPLRVLRAARFAARFADDGFVIAAETLQLMRQISTHDELATLANERVWQETVKALNTSRPAVYFKVLKDAEALSPWFPELEDNTTFHAVQARLSAIDMTTAELVFALWMGELSAAQINLLSERLRVPKEWRQLGKLACRWHAAAQQLTQHKVFAECALHADLWRRPERFGQLLLVWRQQGLTLTEQEKLQTAFDAADRVSAATLIEQARAAGESLVGPEIGAAVQQARDTAIAGVLKE